MAMSTAMLEPPATKDGSAHDVPPAGRGLFSNYLFVDRATQAYTLVVGLLLLFFHNQTVPAWPWLVAAHLALVVGIHALIRAGSRPQAPKWLRFLRYYYPILLYTAFFSESGRINRMFFSDYLDPLIIRWEQALLGFQPAVSFMQALPHLLISELFYAAYFSYYAMVSVVGLALLLRNRTQFFHFVSVVSFVFYVCYIIYVFVPVIGPRVFRYSLGGFTLPSDLVHLATAETYPEAVTHGPFFQLMRWVYAHFEVPGSALPSSHVAIALTTVYFSFLYVRCIRYAHLALAILLCLATMYCGYHYFIDVLGGVLAAAILIPIANCLYRRDSAAVKPPP
ncbi:phosphatase PAP2 family protein [bacterium]|nr:phosphatase PAP2 family protein [bacterium]